MNAVDLISIVLIGAGLLFFAAGTVGLLRFPDLYCRLHALTKADNVGLGFIVLALTLHAQDAATVFKLVLIWLLVLVASASVCFLIAAQARRAGIKPVSRGTQR